jgi:DNA recombination-dependent growth factor C
MFLGALSTYTVENVERGVESTLTDWLLGQDSELQFSGQEPAELESICSRKTWVLSQ